MFLGDEASSSYSVFFPNDPPLLRRDEEQRDTAETSSSSSEDSSPILFIEKLIFDIQYLLCSFSEFIGYSISKGFPPNRIPPSSGSSSDDASSDGLGLDGELIDVDEMSDAPVPVHLLNEGEDLVDSD